METIHEPLRLRYFAAAREIVDISEFQSIIMGGLEYDICDTTQVKQAQIDEKLCPFITGSVYLDGIHMIPIKELMEKLGGEITFDKTLWNIFGVVFDWMWESDDVVFDEEIYDDEALAEGTLIPGYVIS